jgi:hypothetical protein
LGPSATGDEAAHCDSETLPARAGGDGTVQVELGRCGGLASGVALVGGGWRRGSTGARVLMRRRRKAATERHGGDGGARAAATGSTEEAGCSCDCAGSGDGSDALGQRGVASSNRGTQTRPVGVAVAHARRGAVGRQAGAARRCRGVGGAGEASCQDARRAVPTAALSRGGHAATARCHVGPARRAAADRSGPLVSDFRIKIHPEGN